MPSFPSYYLSDLDRKRERSRKLREGLQSGMAGAFEGVDRLAQLQMALQGKANAGAEAKAKAEKEAEALAHGREIEAANQARADQRFAWEGEDRTRKMAREDAADVATAKPDRLSQVKDRLDPDAIVVDEKEQRTKKNELIKAAVENAIETGEDPEAMNSRIRDYLADQGILGVGSSEVRAAYGAAKRARGGEALDMRKMEADAAIAERKAKGGGGGVPGVTSKKEIDRQLAELRLKAAEAKAAGGQLPTVSDARAVTEIDAALGELGKIGRDASKIDTGPIADAQSVARSLAGMPDAEVVKFKSRVGEQLAQYIKGISGATVAKEERARLLENVPTFQDNDVEFDAKLERVIETLNGWRQREINAMKAAGKKTEQFGAAPSGSPSAGPLGNAPPRDPSETRRAYYERLRAGGMDHQTALAAARGGQ